MTGPDVTLVVPTLRGGGAQQVAVTLVTLLDDHGVDVELVLFNAVGPFLSDVPQGVSLVDLGASRSLFAIPGLVRYLRRRRPATILASMDQTIVATLVSAWLANVDARVVGQVHNTMSRVAGGLRARVQRVLARLLYARCSAILAVSEGVARDLVRLGVPERVVRVVHNPVPVDDISRAAERTPPHPWFSDDGPPVILSIGRLTKQKDHGTLIRAFARLQDQTPCRLVILGEGEDRAIIERLVVEEGVEQGVDLPGFTDDPAPYLGHAAVFVLSSAWEGLPTVMVEALAAGTPVVATDCESGPREILAGGRYGRLVPVADPDAMAVAIFDALREEPNRNELRHRARDFSPETLLPDYLRLLRPQA